MLFRNGSAQTEPNKNEELLRNTLLAQDQKFLRYGARQVKAQLNLGGKFTWAGMKTLYFLTALVPQNFQLDTLIAAGLVDRRLGWIAGVNGARTSDRYSVYLGPLAYSTLRACNLQAAFDFGHFLVIDLKWIGLPILKFLQLVYRLVKNFGLAIIIFAIIMKAIFFPLSRAQTARCRTCNCSNPSSKNSRNATRTTPRA